MQHSDYPPGMNRNSSAPSPVADNPPFPAPPVQETWQQRLATQAGPNQNTPGYGAPAQAPYNPASGYAAPAPQPAPAPGYAAPVQQSGYGAPVPQQQPLTWRDLMQRWQAMNKPPPPRRLFAPRQPSDYGVAGGMYQQPQPPQNPYGTPDNRGLPVASRANLGSNHLNTWQQRLAGGQAGGPGKQPMIPQSRY